MKGGDWNDEVKGKVLGFVSKYIPKKSDIELLKSKLKNGENITILEFISPKVDLKKNETYVESSSLGNQKVYIEEHLLEQFPRLLQGGLWGGRQFIIIKLLKKVVKFGFKILYHYKHLKLILKNMHHRDLNFL